jgi:hypothetical protein
MEIETLHFGFTEANPPSEVGHCSLGAFQRSHRPSLLNIFFSSDANLSSTADK